MSAVDVAPTTEAPEAPEAPETEERGQAARTIAGYLKAIKDPDLTIDTTLIGALESTLEDTDDPVERINIRAKIAKAKQPRLDTLRASFLAVLPQWAKENEIPVEVLREEGVPEKDLKDSGLVKTTRRGSPRGSSKDAEAWIRKQDGAFTVSGVADGTPVSRSTAAKTVTRLLEEGVIEESGEVPGHGRSAKTYQVKKA